MLIDASQEKEIRVAVLQDSRLVDFDFENIGKKPLKGNIYLGKIVRIEPSLQAAFVDYGCNRHGFLAFTEIHPDYFRIPVADREAMLETEGSIEGISIDEGIVEEEITEEIREEVVPDVQEAQEGGVGEDSTGESKEQQESLDAEEEDVRKKFALYRNYKIQEVLHSRQVVLVQVVKEERGNKGAALTTFVSLAGRYSVLMPNALNAGGVSRKITDIQHRKRLRDLMKDLGVPEGMSLIIRTAGLDRSKAEIKRDYAYLIKLWSQIREETLKATAPTLIYEEANLIRRSLRDVYTPDIEEIWVEGEEAFKEAKNFMKTLIPTHVKRIKEYKDTNHVSLFHKYEIEQQIEQVYAPEVKLQSGGYIVMNVTEALVAIDVNSGQATRERHIDSTALKTNLEAAEEIARQLRIRDLAGLLVIDFIDMSEVRHNIAVEKKLKECLASDRARIQVGRISQFGLLEMSRQRLRPSVVESISIRCPYCVGAGFVRSKESLSLQLLRVLEAIALKRSGEEVLKVKLSSDLAFYLLREKRKEIFELEQRRGCFFVLEKEESLGAAGFHIEDSMGNFLVDSIGAKGEGRDADNHEKNRRDQGRPAKKRQRNQGQRRVTKFDESGEIEQKITEETSVEVEEGGHTEEARHPQDQKKRSRNKRRRNKNRGNRQDIKAEDSSQMPSSFSEDDEDVRPTDVNGNTLSNSNTLEDSSLPATLGLEDTGRPVKRGHKGKSSGWWKKLLDNN